MPADLDEDAVCLLLIAFRHGQPETDWDEFIASLGEDYLDD